MAGRDMPGGVVGGLVTLFITGILGFVFYQVFQDLPGGKGWAILFVIVIIVVGIAVFLRIIVDARSGNYY